MLQDVPCTRGPTRTAPSPLQFMARSQSQQQLKFHERNHNPSHAQWRPRSHPFPSPKDGDTSLHSTPLLSSGHGEPSQHLASESTPDPEKHPKGSCPNASMIGCLTAKGCSDGCSHFHAFNISPAILEHQQKASCHLPFPSLHLRFRSHHFSPAPLKEKGKYLHRRGKKQPHHIRKGEVYT